MCKSACRGIAAGGKDVNARSTAKKRAHVERAFGWTCGQGQARTCHADHSPIRRSRATDIYGEPHNTMLGNQRISKEIGHEGQYGGAG